MAICAIGNYPCGRLKGASSAAHDAGPRSVTRATAGRAALSAGVRVIAGLVETVAPQEAAASLTDRSLLGTVCSGDTQSSAFGLGQLVGRPGGIDRFLMHSTIESRFFTFVNGL